MRYAILIPICFVASILAHGAMAAQPSADASHVVIGDCGAVLDSSKHVDVRRTIDALVGMHMNTFAYSMQESPTAWEQLPEFADAAAKQGINVWVYLAPWSETPPLRPGKAPCEPFRLDFVAWAQHTAELSKQHPNITAILLDDFAPNDTQPERFTPQYTRAMKLAAAAVNPALKIDAILYFDQPWADFVDRYSELIDAAVVCYPASQEEIDSAANYLSGNAHGAAMVLDMGAHDIGANATTGMVTTIPPRQADAIRFLFDDASISRSTGEHVAFVTMNGKMVWSRRIAERCRDEVVELLLPASSSAVRIVLGVMGHARGDRSEYTTRFDDVLLLKSSKPVARQPKWQLIDRASVAATLSQASAGTGHRVPMMLMPAVAPFEYARRYNPPVTPTAIGDKIELCLKNLHDGKSVGIVNFCTPKDPSDPVMQLVTKLFTPEMEAALGPNAPRD